MDVSKARRQLGVLRWICWVALCGEVAVIAGFVRFLVANPGHLMTLLWTLALILGFYQGLPWLAARFTAKTAQRVGAAGDHWRIGRYSEAEVRGLAMEVAAMLPPWLRRLDIRIADRRETGGWTLLSWVWPGWPERTAIWVTAGALHYLDSDELKALLLHEAGHHAGVNRNAVRAAWLLGDVALYSLVFWGGALGGQHIKIVVLVFLIARSLVAALIAGPMVRASRMSEHFCDLYAAERVGAEAVISMLLKSGEEEELAEVVVARAARELRHTKAVTVEDLELVFEEVRPHGRIFHDNLLRHASEVVGKVTATTKPSRRPPKVTLNEELDEYVRQRRFARRHRIRWRSFDLDADGRLSTTEVRALCQALRDNPDHAFFVCEGEREPTTHPSYRDRVLLLESASMGAQMS